MRTTPPCDEVEGFLAWTTDRHSGKKYGHCLSRVKTTGGANQFIKLTIDDGFEVSVVAMDKATIDNMYFWNMAIFVSADDKGNPNGEYPGVSCGRAIELQHFKHMNEKKDIMQLH